MKSKPCLTICLLAAGLCVMGQSSSCTAPLDVNGSYEGIWSFERTDNGTVEEVIDCPLAMTLVQDLSQQGAGSYGVTGTLQVDFSCFAENPDWPDWLEIPEDSNIDVIGTLDANGKLYLASGGCAGGACIVLILDGMGKSGAVDDGSADNETGLVMTYNQEIPAMARYSGNWGVGLGIAFLGEAGASGTFEVVRVE